MIFARLPRTLFFSLVFAVIVSALANAQVSVSNDPEFYGAVPPRW